jgi:hypothetical protein
MNTTSATHLAGPTENLTRHDHPEPVTGVEPPVDRTSSHSLLRLDLSTRKGGRRERRPMHDLEQVIRERRSTRMFLPDKPVPRELVDEALELAVRAPSNSNIQP